MTNEEIKLAGEAYVMHTYARLPFALVKGEGTRVWDADGKEYLDFVGGLAVNSLGHCHPKVVSAIQRQAKTMLHCSNLYWIEPQVELAKLLVENSDLDKVFFANSGAEANEGAIKLARKFARLKGKDKCEIITMQQSFHGRTLATLTATGQEKFHKDFTPLPDGFTYVPFNDIDALKQAVGPQTAAVMLEPVQGEGGVYPAETGFLKQVRQLCDEHNLLLIFDEIQCGLGRTGRLFAYQHYEVKPDIMTLAKALAGGVPIGALLATADVASAFVPGDHASTFGGNPLACAAGVAALSALLDDGIVTNAREVGAYFKQQLLELKACFSVVKEVRGFGLMLGMELTVDAGSVVSYCQENRLLINCVGGSTLRFLPPLIVSVDEVDAAVELLGQGLSKSASS